MIGRRALISPELRLPVLNERDRGGNIVQEGVDQEAAIAGDVVIRSHIEVCAASNDPHMKQRRRAAGLDG